MNRRNFLVGAFLGVCTAKALVQEAMASALKCVGRADFLGKIAKSGKKLKRKK